MAVVVTQQQKSKRSSGSRRSGRRRRSGRGTKSEIYRTKCRQFNNTLRTHTLWLGLEWKSGGGAREGEWVGGESIFHGLHLIA